MSAPTQEVASAAPPPSDKQPATLNLKVTASPSLVPILARNNISVLFSTYDAGKVIILRSAGERLNVHFVGFGRTMGLAGDLTRLAVGTSHSILELYNFPGIVSELPRGDSEPTPDACFVLRHSHVTGNIDIHEMAWGGDELWFVNSRFSCLCTRDRAHSFIPRWRPPFIKGLSPDDRCHLNGLAMSGARPAYVTAIAASDEPEGWRADRVTGGIVMEVASGEIVARGLSMPHSPRLYREELFVLDSGTGSLGKIDRRSGRRDAIAAFSGFTRGLDIYNDLAFVGLSQVRDKPFGGLPLTERLREEERFCGMQVLDLATGRVEAFLKFESGVQEIFAVHVIPGARFPTILEEDDPLLASAIALPPDALAQLRG